jgi:hypothetical protein
MHAIERHIHQFLEKCGSSEIDEKFIHEFGERCKDGLRRGLLEPGGNRLIRLSSIGKPLRQLMLDKKHGIPPAAPTDKLKFTIGYLYEALMVFLLDAAGCGVEEVDKKVTLTVDGKDINGSFDVKIGGKIWDVKTASDYSYNFKFKDVDSLARTDSFGYMSQGFGYAKADGCDFGGWIVFHKVTGDFKVVPIPNHSYKRYATDSINTIKENMKCLHDDNAEMPPCTGVVDEEWYGKKTGNKILNKECEWCSHKFKCHPGLQALLDVNSKAKEPKIKYYVELKDKDNG